MSDEEAIRQRIIDWATCSDGSIFNDESCITEDMSVIRPSGNPISWKGMGAMFNSGMVKVTKAEIGEIFRITVCGDLAYAVFSQNGEFTYDGKENKDYALFTGIFKKVDGVWKWDLAQRSTGRDPSDPSKLVKSLTS